MEIRKSLVTWGLRWDWMLTTDGHKGTSRGDAVITKTGL